MTLLIDSIIMIIDASFPLGIVMSPRTFYLSVFNRFWRDPSLKGLLPDLSPRGDAEAVELLGAGFPVPYGDEEGQGVANEVVWAFGRFEP